MKAALVAALLAVSGPSMAAGSQWTWEAGKQTNNGAITIKSTSGSTTYSGTQNPTGAIAKTNQTAVTQPPTVIIQATSGAGEIETIPLLEVSTTIPSCPAGYDSIWSMKSFGCSLPYAVYNIGGTKFSFKQVPDSSYIYYGFAHDDQGVANRQICKYVSTTYNWAANLCVKK